MRKFCVLFLIAVMAMSMMACTSEKVTLHCDGENCNNTVELDAGYKGAPDESWIVFCQECADNKLSD